MPELQNTSGWGRYPQRESTVHTPKSEAAAELLAPHFKGIVRGNGRSYGDAALAENILSTLSCDQQLDFDSTAGTVTASSGVLLGDILKICVPEGWFLAVTPGTQWISLGGAIAADVHGKNHPVAGTFRNSVVGFDLVLPKGEKKYCSTQENATLFDATFGGMGLTGVVLNATIQLKRIETAFFSQTHEVKKSLPELLAAFLSNNEPYQIAWMDHLSKTQRYIFSAAHWCASSELPQGKAPLEVAPIKPKKVPVTFPRFVLSKGLMRQYNNRRFKQLSKTPHEITGFQQMLYPLDAIESWNKIYGPNGFVQHQCVFPKEEALAGLTAIEKLLKQSKHSSYLSVLKRLGEANSKTNLSFPESGFTLAMDFKKSTGLEPFLHQLDEVVLQHKGKIYLAKDACLQAHHFAAMYPNAEKFNKTIAEINDGNWNSDLSDRLGILKSPQTKNNMQETTLILGANSDIAKAMLPILAKKGHHLQLADRIPERLQALKQELESTYKIQVDLVAFDAEKFDSHPDFVAQLNTVPTNVVTAFGYLGDPAIDLYEAKEYHRILAVNMNGLVSVLNPLVAAIEKRGTGTVVGISSVAGERGKKANLVYSAAKAGATAYLDGLRQKFAKSNIHVMTVKPGYVATKMTAGLDTPPSLTAQPEDVAKAIVKGMESKKNVLYYKSKWALLMWIIRHVPEFMYKKMKFGE